MQPTTRASLVIRWIALSCRADGSCDLSAVKCEPITCTLEDAPKSEIIQYSGRDIPDKLVALDLGERLKFECDEGYTVTGTPDGLRWFTVTCQDGLHTMSSRQPVGCGDAPVSAFAVANADGGQSFTHGPKVTQNCQVGCHVGLNRSKKFWAMAPKGWDVRQRF